MFENSPINQLLMKNPSRSEADLRSNQLDLL
jgi:hypothetical protein